MTLVKTKTADLPIIDISSLYSEGRPAYADIGAKILKAAETYGFFYLTGHGISDADIQRCFKASHTYFSQSPEFKNKNSILLSDRFQGYEPPTKKESKEAYVLGPERSANDPLIEKGEKYHGVNVWPEEISALKGWRDLMVRQMQAMLSLTRLINRALAVGLDIPIDYFDKRSDDPMCAFRLLHYTPAGSSNDLPGIDDHTDWGALSLLIQDSVPGLEVLMPDQTWAVVQPVPGTIVVNIGELVARWTNDRLKATRHRVRNLSDQDRYSMAFFLDMNHDAVIEPLETCISDPAARRYDPIRVSEFIDLMHKRDYEDAA